MTQPPIVPGPYDPTQGWEAQPPASPPVYYPPQAAPPGPYQPPPPQIVYVQQDPRLAKQHVAQGVGSAATTGLIVVLAVCLGIPLMLFAGWMILAGLGWLASR